MDQAQDGTADALRHESLLEGTPAEFKAALGQTSIKILDDWQPGQVKEF